MAMKKVFVLFFFAGAQLIAQDPDKSALTAGCEFSDFHAEPPNSITSGYQIIEYPYTFYKLPDTEQKLSSPKTTSIALANNKPENSLIYVLAFLLVGIAVFFITSKNKSKSVLNSQIPLEEEEEELRKKQLWNALSDPDAVELE